MQNTKTAKSDIAGSDLETITFLVGTREFCIDVMVVREIRGWIPATPVAHALNFVCGVINLRGNVLPIIDFAACLGDGPTEPTSRHAILVVECKDQVVGLLVEGVSEILTTSRNLLQRLPPVVCDRAQEFTVGLIATDDRMISLINLDAVVPSRTETLAV